MFISCAVCLIYEQSMKSLYRFQLNSCSLIQQSAPLHQPGIVHTWPRNCSYKGKLQMRICSLGLIHNQLPCILQVSHTHKKEHRYSANCTPASFKSTRQISPGQYSHTQGQQASYLSKKLVFLLFCAILL